jgi:hypothetical protein
MTLLDDLMPVYDVVERHSIIVRAAPPVVFQAIRAADLGGGLLARLLLALRAVPAAVLAIAASPRGAVGEWRARRAERGRGVRLADFERAGFRVVAERAPEELLIGLLGRFWTPRGGICHDVAARHFSAGPPAGYALAAWNFTVSTRADGGSELRTETRVRCARDARGRFRAYWFIVRPGSGLIRRSMLQAIRREAERQPTGTNGEPAATGPGD